MAFGFFRIFKGLNVVPKVGSTADALGDIEVNSSTNKANFHNGSSTSPLVTEAHAATLTNKTMDANSNTFSNFDHGVEVNNPSSGVHGVTGNIVGTSDSQTLTNKTMDANSNTFSNFDHGVEVNNPSSGVHGVVGTIVGTTDSQVLTNKTIDADLNTLSNIENADIKAGAAIARNKLASGNNYRIVANNATGVMSENAALTAAHVIIADANGQLAGEATLAKSRGGSGQDNSSVTFPASGVLVTETGTQTLTNKTFGDATTHLQVATPSNPAATFNKLYFKNDEGLYSLSSGGVETQYGTTTGTFEPKQNFLYNSNFSLWQRGTSVTVANAISTYQADRWYVKNSLGTNGVITYSQVAGVSDGAKFGASVKITTAPSAAQTNGTELYQTLENFDSLQLYNQDGCFSIKVKALGNVNQCGIQFLYKTTEAKVDTTIGSEVTASVNTSTFSTITISGQALGTSMTTSGVIGVRIRITGVSSGNTYDLNNGFIVEQGIVNLGTTIATYQPKFKTIASEIEECERYYQKSYALTTNPGTASILAGSFKITGVSTSFVGPIIFRTRMRGTPSSVTTYSTVTGTSARIRDTDVGGVGADLVATTADPGESGFNVTATTSTNNDLQWHWSADAEI